MDYYLVALRLLHIVFGAIWIGFALFVPFILMPALFEAGPSAGPVMATLQRRGLPKIMSAVAGTSILAGILLLWHVSGGFKPEFMGSRMGIALSSGALASIIAYAIGLSVVRPSMNRAATMSQELASVTSDTERAARMAAIAALRARGAAGGKIVADILLFAVAAMAVARYV